jgi:hypothetical protein
VVRGQWRRDRERFHAGDAPCYPCGRFSVPLESEDAGSVFFVSQVADGPQSAKSPAEKGRKSAFVRFARRGRKSSNYQPPNIQSGPVKAGQGQSRPAMDKTRTENRGSKTPGTEHSTSNAQSPASAARRGVAKRCRARAIGDVHPGGFPLAKPLPVGNVCPSSYKITG